MSLIRSLLSNPISTDIWSPSGFSNEVSNFANAQVDWKETTQAHIIKADLPGLKKEEVKVEVEEGRVLQISGGRCGEKEDQNGKFLRRFRLPENAKVDEVKASMK